ncbi:MAG: hypothetical protein V3V04_04755 [Rhizobiaceae bacterium]
MAKLAFYVLITFFLVTMNAANGSDWHGQRVTTPLPLSLHTLAENGLPDGGIAIASPEHKIHSAWYSKPTTRYGHGILGDAIEAGGLSVKLVSGSVIEFTLPLHQVFEDITPRLHDLGTTGELNIITILTDVELGASLAVFAIVNNELKLIDQTPYIGRSHRWRNVAGIADFDGDGNLQIAEVVTPHIGGTLKFWTWKKDKLVVSGEMMGFSNHFIGSREQELSTIEDFDGDGVSDIALPSADRKSLRLIKFKGKARGAKTLEEIASIPFPARIDKHIHSKFNGSSVIIHLGLEDGSLWSVYE